MILTAYFTVAMLAALAQIRVVNQCVDLATDASVPARERRAAAIRIGTVAVDALLWPLTVLLAIVGIGYAAVIVASSRTLPQIEAVRS